MYKIYKYTNLINGKIYIGQTKNTLEQRAINGTNYKGSTYFYNAIQKYGWNNFKPEILEDNLTLEEANQKEEYYISLFDSTNPEIGYNIRLGGNNSQVAESTKKIISSKAIERYKDKTKNPMYGKTHSIESIHKMSELKSGKSNPMYGRKLSKESRKKISEHHKGENNPIHNHIYTDEERIAMSEKFSELAKNWSKKVICIEDDMIFDTITSASDYYGVKKATLSGHLNGRQKSCKNKHFKFVS